MLGGLMVNGAVSMSILLSAMTGDQLLRFNQHDIFLKAVCDNLTHAVIAGFTWIGVIASERLSSLLSGRSLAEVLLCSFIASGIDADHFVSALSLNLKDAVSLPSRPFLHCTSIPLAISSILFFIAYVCELYAIERLSWLVIAASFSHHIRDAARHGLWLWPFGSTPPLGSYLYLPLVAVFPVVLSFTILNVRFAPQRSPSLTIV